MNLDSNTSGTNTSMTLLDYNSSCTHSDDGSGLNDDFRNTSISTSRTSVTTTNGIDIQNYPQQQELNGLDTGITYQIFNHILGKFKSYPQHNNTTNRTVEYICLDICKSLEILPTTCLLFGLKYFDSYNEWLPAAKTLQPNEKYEFRMRFKVPSLGSLLQSIDLKAYEYLYRQMRYDMINERILEIRYPLKKDNVMGLGVLDMYIDSQENKNVTDIEANYRRYLPRKLIKTHKMFVKKKICKSFEKFRLKNIEVDRVKWNYVNEVHNLAPSYLIEIFEATYIPTGSLENHNLNSRLGENEMHMSTFESASEIRVYVKLDLYDGPEPGLKIARLAPEDRLEWIHLTKLDNIIGLSIISELIVAIEIKGFSTNYCIKFKSLVHMEAFITYLVGYIRLTSKWMFDMCGKYESPSLSQLKKFQCHGPVGGNFSFSKLRDKRDKVGSYILRQCEKEYDTYYIDINVARMGNKCKTETFKIKWDNNTYKLFIGDKHYDCDDLNDLPYYISTENVHKKRILPSEFDKPSLLLLCLPKNSASKRTETELSEIELQRKRVQIFNAKTDLQWHQNTRRDCENKKMWTLETDWLLDGSFKEVPATSKVLKYNEDFGDFMKLANTLCQINFPQFIKLYGLTISSPYTLILESAKFGPLNEFMQNNKERITTKICYNVTLGLVRGIVALQELGIVHGYIRCSNLLVTKYDGKTNNLEAKIGDTGLPRTYTTVDLPWIPLSYYNDLNSAKKDLKTDFWAFSTTVWEIFAKGTSMIGYTKEILSQNYNIHGGILPRDNCPEKLYNILLDGWSIEPEVSFDQQKIFHCISTEMPDISNSNDDDPDDEPEPREEPNLPIESNLGELFDGVTYVLKIPNGKILLTNKNIGSGHYGTVHLGEIKYEDTKIPNEKVAIKTMNNKLRDQKTEKKDFQREIDIMVNLDHPNIVKFKYYIKDPFSIVMEYIEGGSFTDYLKHNKPNLTNQKLLDFALDIAKGMDYLCQQKIIHRDLAARNILVDRDRVKISDFGLSQIADQDGYYTSQTEREIPIKWYSPEAIESKKFSFQSDVWSYGVTLYEIFSRGASPDLKHVSTDDFLAKLNKGDRLEQHKLCPNIFYDQLMVPCWHKIPKERPTFKQLVDKIQSIKGQSI